MRPSSQCAEPLSVHPQVAEHQCAPSEATHVSPRRGTWLSVARAQAAILPERIVVLLLRAYRKFVSPGLPPACRFHPTCSVYALEAIERHGLLRGLGMSILRLSKCHPLHRGGFDPVK